MNQKTAKHLRRKAREMTVGLPARQHLRHSQTGQIINSPKTTRGAYRSLKRGIKTGALELVCVPSQ